MEFRNLTPLHAMAYSAVDVPGNEFHIVALKAGYGLEECRSHDPAGDTHRCVLLERDAAVSLAMADEYEGDSASSSIKWESDLAPFKPKCDVLIRATSFAPLGVPAAMWPARVRVMDSGKLVVDKGLRILGPREFRKDLRGWRLCEPELCNEVPVRWEYAYGGTSIVLPAPGAPDSAEKRQLNEVCFTNPLGCGWLEKRYLELATDKEMLASPDVLSAPAKQTKIKVLRAPQIEAWDRSVSSIDVVKHPGTALEAKQMAEIAASYSLPPAGLRPIGRAWTPRLQRAGTYDAAWLENSWPYLPSDFDFHYWNGAPDDQQIAWPKPGLSFELANLAKPEHTRSGFLRARLPEHRALVALRFASGAIAPIAMRLDTVLIDTDTMRVLTTWRAAFPVQPPVRVCEARFEIDPAAPLLKFNTEHLSTEKEFTWQTT